MAQVLSMGKLRWRLNEVMARHFIRVDYLAERVGISPQALSNLKNRTDMPRIDGERLCKLCDELTLMVRETEPGITISPQDLIEYVPDNAA
jgi:putative transcriptional regulator